MLAMPIAKPVALKKPESGPFEDQAVAVMGRLRQSLMGILGSISKGKTGGIRRAADVQRELNINRKLAWQVYTIAYATDPLAQANHVPKQAAMQGFLDAASKHGIPARLIKSAQAAFGEFDELVRVHAGSRSAMDSMVSGLRDDRGEGEGGSDPVGLLHRRAAFNANSHIWGVQATTHFSCHLYAPSATDTSRIDVAHIRGLLNLRRLRRDTSWVITRTKLSDDDGKERRTVIREPLDPAGDDPPGLFLMSEYCSQPLPAFRTYKTASGISGIELVGASVGNLSSVTCIAGDYLRNSAPRYQEAHNTFHAMQTLIRTPCEVGILDLLVAKETFGSISPRVQIYGDQRAGDLVFAGREMDLLSQREAVKYLGSGLGALHTPDVPRYAEMVEFAMGRMGWDASQFDLWRCRVEYPVMPSSVVVQFDLPEKPGG